MTDPNLPPVTPPSGQQPQAPAQQPPAAPAYQQQPPAAPGYYQPQQQQPQQPGYGQQPYGAPVEKYNVLAIVSLVTGILTISLVAIITGHIALSQITKTLEKGRGLAIAGLVLGYAGIVIGILVFFLLFIPLMTLVTNNPSVLNG
ncbi:MAG: DUF4190 domain-containing protein [Cryobacterium sp.]